MGVVRSRSHRSPVAPLRTEHAGFVTHSALQRLHLLVIDELRYVPFSQAGAELLFEVTSRAYEHHSLKLTTNLAFEEWTEIFDSERLTGALLDRLTHRCYILEANGESYRLRQARKRSNWKPSTRQDSNPQEKDK